jgi:hypothetical protein
MRIPIYKVRNDYNKSMSEEARNREGRLVESTVPWSDFYRLSQENKALTAQVAALREALHHIAVELSSDPDFYTRNNSPAIVADRIRILHSYARAALAKDGAE